MATLYYPVHDTGVSYTDFGELTSERKKEDTEILKQKKEDIDFDELIGNAEDKLYKKLFKETALVKNNASNDTRTIEIGTVMPRYIEMVEGQWKDERVWTVECTCQNCLITHVIKHSIDNSLNFLISLYNTFVCNRCNYQNIHNPASHGYEFYGVVRIVDPNGRLVYNSEGKTTMNMTRVKPEQQPANVDCNYENLYVSIWDDVKKPKKLKKALLYDDIGSSNDEPMIDPDDDNF